MKRLIIAVLLLLPLLGLGGGAFAIAQPMVAFADKGQADCKLMVPPNPLTAAGLATPWVLSSGGATCHESDPNSAVFVQATIFSPSAKSLSVYSPLVIDSGTKPAVSPSVPVLPSDAVVGIFGGGNDNSTHLVGAIADVAQCVNGAPHPFGQVFYCHTPSLFSAMSSAGIVPPPLGTANDGQPCPTVRDWMIVDQDQSDNVQSQYLVSGSGQTAQDTTSNRAALGTFSIAKNPSDNRVLTNFMDKALGCSPWTAPDLANGGAPSFSQALDEYQANALQAFPQALMPAGDPMTMANGTSNLSKINLYRVGVDQPAANSLTDASTSAYCANILFNAPARLNANQAALLALPSPVSSAANSLWTFMAQRLSFTLSAPAGQGLDCTGLGFKNPVHLTLDSAGVTVAAVIDS